MFQLIHTASNRVIATLAAKPVTVAPGYRVVRIDSLAAVTLTVGPL